MIIENHSNLCSKLQAKTASNKSHGNSKKHPLNSSSKYEKLQKNEKSIASRPPMARPCVPLHAVWTNCGPIVGQLWPNFRANFGPISGKLWTNCGPILDKFWAAFWANFGPIAPSIPSISRVNHPRYSAYIVLSPTCVFAAFLNGFFARYRKRTIANPSQPGASSATTGCDGECLESLLRAP